MGLKVSDCSKSRTAKFCVDWFLQRGQFRPNTDAVLHPRADWSYEISRRNHARAPIVASCRGRTQIFILPQESSGKTSINHKADLLPKEQSANL